MRKTEYAVTAQLVTQPAAIHMRGWKLNFSGGRYTINDGQGGVILSIKDGVIPHSDVTPILLAAPELLCACQAALAYLADPPSAFKSNRDQAVINIRAAIAKAEGK